MATEAPVIVGYGQQPGQSVNTVDAFADQGGPGDNPGRKHAKHSDVPDMTPEEVQRRGDNADALWRD